MQVTQPDRGLHARCAWGSGASPATLLFFLPLARFLSAVTATVMPLGRLCFCSWPGPFLSVAPADVASPLQAAFAGSFLS